MVRATDPIRLPDAPDGFIFLGYWGFISEGLGYEGTARYVGWYWEPCGDELTWYDGRIGLCGAENWYAWVRTVAPLLPHLGYDCGSPETEAKVWLVCHGQTGAAYGVPPYEARVFLQAQWK
jgi:hypothetical protein